jgi:Ca2+-binding RTX toxin-like protein
LIHRARSRVLLLATVTTLMLALGSTAHAATVSIEGTAPNKTLVYQAAPGETNTVMVFEFDSGVVSFSEYYDAAPVLPGPGCTQGSGNWVDCSATGATSTVVNLGDGSDEVQASGNLTLRLFATGGNDRSDGGRQVDFDGGPGNDSFVDDVWHWDDGGDHFTGGDGYDTADYSWIRGSTSLTLDGVSNDGYAGENDNVEPDVEHIITGIRDDTIVGTGAAQTIDGGMGSDHIEGGGGDDVIDGGAEDCSPDTISGGSGNDTINGEGGGDDIDAGPGNDTIRNRGCMPDGDTLSGGTGTDTVDYSDSYKGVTVTLDGLANDGVDGEDDNVVPDVENVIGGHEDDVLVGSSANNLLSGLGGDDLLGGGPGNDTLSGSVGVDVLNGGSGADVLDGGSSEDIADYSDRSTAVSVDLDGEQGDDGAPGEGDTVQASVEDIWGGAGADKLTGSNEDNVLDGGPGSDLLVGLGGEDATDYSLRTEPVHVTLDDVANDGAAGEGDNVAGDIEELFGGDGDDTLVGNSVDNLLDGGLGADSMTGGGGLDVVDYSTRTGGVVADLDGSAGDDGEAGEGDTIAADVEGLFGGAGDDMLTGNSANGFLVGDDGDDVLSDPGGADVVDAGPGDDKLRTRDGAADEDLCGYGYDVVSRDSADTVDDCESVDPPLGNTEPPSLSPQRPPRSPTLKFPTPFVDRSGPQTSRTLPPVRSLARALAHGVRVEVACDESCSVRATLKLLSGGAVVARGSLAYGAAGKRELTLHFGRAAKRALRDRRTERFRLTIVATDAYRNTTTVTTRWRLGTG